jgi:hypothetical protein
MTGAVSTSADLVEWNKRLASALLVPGHSDEPLYVYVDEDVLAEASDLAPQDAVTSFLGACRPFVVGDRPFGYALRQAQRWQRSGAHDSPPHLWALALTVLAATSDPVGATDSVYRVQNSLLGRPEDTTPPPGYAEDVPDLWTIFNQWLAGAGRDFGLPTARPHPRWVRQGWARSQALFRFRDRQIVESFFAASGLVPGSHPDPSSMVDAFEEWLHYRGAAGDTLRARLRGDAERAVAADVLAQEAARWTGQPRSRALAGTLTGLLTVDDWTNALGMVVRSERLVGLEIDPGDGTRVSIDEAASFVELHPGASQREVLEDGTAITLSPGVTVSVGGAVAYAFADEPSLGLLLQVVGPVETPDCRLLVRQSQVANVETALISSGAVFSRSTAPTAGWSWLNVYDLPSGCASLAAIGLGGLAAPRRAAPRLSGGLRVAPSTYLSGGEPRLELPDPGEILLDGKQFQVASAGLDLAALGLNPGPHELVCADGQTLRFSSVAGIRPRAVSGGYAWPLTGTGAAKRVAGPCRADAEGLSGAHIPGAGEVLDTPMLRWGGDVEYLAAFESGALVQFWPTAARWVAQVGIAPLQADPLQTVRTSLDVRPRAFLSWSQRSGRVKSLEIPPEAQLPRGTMRRRERPDLVSEIFGRSWDWVAREEPQLQSKLRAQAMGWARGRTPSLTQGAQLTSPNRRLDLREAPTPNPYDDLLWWLSERESGSADLVAVRDTWAWACDACGFPTMSGQWRRALAILGQLGHVERDFARGRVAVAPGTLLRLPASNGLHALCGARPAALLERLDDPDDADNRVADAASALVVHRRIPTRDGRPAGPTAVLVEWDMTCREAVVRGLRVLGVEIEAGDAMALLPSLQEALEGGTQLSASPARQAQFRLWPPYEAPRWVERTTDEMPGLYQYRLGWRDAFAFRGGRDQPLIEVDRYIGLWADERFRGRGPRMLHHPLSNRLLIDAALPPPPLLARALALRTGLPPWKASGVRTDERRTPTDYVIYDNVNDEIARQAARVVGQEHVSTTAALEEP